MQAKKIKSFLSYCNIFIIFYGAEFFDSFKAFGTNTHFFDFTINFKCRPLQINLEKFWRYLSSFSPTFPSNTSTVFFAPSHYIFLSANLTNVRHNINLKPCLRRQVKCSNQRLVRLWRKNSKLI